MSKLLDNLSRLANENDKEYRCRIYSYKDELGWSWNDIASFFNSEFGVSYTPDKYRKESYQLNNEDNYEIDEKLLSLNKERVRLSDERIQMNAMVRSLAREDSFKELAIECAKTVDARIPLTFKPAKAKKNTKKSAILCIGDWHYGLDVDLYLNEYSPEIAIQRIQRLNDKVVEILEKEDIHELNVINLGDMISGRIHLPLRLNSRLDAVSQTIDVAEILAEFLNSLSTAAKINYYSVSDNHSRVEPNKKEALKAESFSRIIDWFIAERLKDNKGVTFCENVLGDDIATFSIFDHKVLAVHGDRDPQRSIIPSLTSFTKEHYDLIISAHMHHFSADENNETEFYCNGSLIGTDDYANSLRLNSKPSQNLFVCTPENVTECIYKIKV